MRVQSLLRTATLTVAAGVLLVPTTAAGAADNPPPWDVVPTPDRDGSGWLTGVAAIGPSDAWAVGQSGPYYESNTLTQHWDGTGWTIVPSPNPPDTTRAWLDDVSAASGDDVWAVGGATPASGGTQPLIEHWDGTDWTIVPSPNAGSSSELNDVAAVSGSEAWAVGVSGPPSAPSSLLLRWSGAKWREVANPCDFALHTVTVISADEVWAAGYQNSCRWDGHSWTKIPVVSYGQTTIVGISGVASDNLWAVARTLSCPYDCSYSYSFRHWDGSDWSLYTADYNVSLSDIHAVSANEFYAVGSRFGHQALILLWDGTRWRETPNAEVAGGLSGVSATSASDLWAVGTTADSGPPMTLAERAPSPTSGGAVGDTGRWGVTVSWFGPESGSVESDDAGAYAVGGLDPGSYTFIATKSGCDPASADVTVVAGVTVTQDLPVKC